MRPGTTLLLLLLSASGCDPGFHAPPTFVDFEVPVDTIRGPVIDLGTGPHHACAATAEGALYCWGLGDTGQLGDGHHRSSFGPVRVEPVAEFVSSSGGYYHTCALDGQGSAWCWGPPLSGALGHERTDAVFGSDPALPIASVPYPVETHLRFSKLDTAGEGPALTCAREHGGSAWCWGLLSLGNGTPGASSRPVPVSGGHVFMDIAVGGAHACGVDDQGQAWCWGSNASGQLGTSSHPGDECGWSFGAECALVPVPVDAATSFVSISAGPTYTCALSIDGAAWCWGDGTWGQTGTGETTASSPPAPVASELRFAALSAGAGHVCALTPGGEVWCWGAANVGTLGTQDGLLACGDPLNLCSPTPVPVDGGFRFERIVAGGGFTCGVGLDGRIRCWGSNHFGTLGIGRATQFVWAPVELVAQR
jgi:alpha-tubulin suppressor-like RCC1 family protein